MTVLWGIGTAQAINAVVGAPGAAQAFAYALAGGAVATTPAWTGAGPAGSRFGASVSGFALQPFGTGASHSLIVGSLGTGLVSFFARLCNGAGCPGPTLYNTRLVRSDFGFSVASARATHTRPRCPARGPAGGRLTPSDDAA